MKPTIQIASAVTPDGNTMSLRDHDGDYSIAIGRDELMSSRRHESECELARLGCAGLVGRRNPQVLIGGLGMGYTLRATLDMLDVGACVVVAELMPEVIEWNRTRIGHLTNHPLLDKRVDLKCRDVIELLRESEGAFDVILLDIDNGTSAVTVYSNDRLYGRQGIGIILGALRQRGCLAIWSASHESGFKRHLQYHDLTVRYFRAAAYPGSKAQPHTIWMASRDPRSLPALPESRAPVRRARPRQAG